MSIEETRLWWEEVWRFYLRVIPLLVALALVFSGVSAFFLNSINTRDAAIQAQAAATAAQSEAQGRLFEIFIEQFVKQNNYICTVVTVRAEQDHLPLPPPGLCSISAP